MIPAFFLMKKREDAKKKSANRAPAFRLTRHTVMIHTVWRLCGRNCGRRLPICGGLNSVFQIFQIEVALLCNRDKGRYLFHVTWVVLSITCLLLAIGGCASSEKADGASNSGGSNQAVQPPVDNSQSGLDIREYLLSPSDEIKITVYNHDELSRNIMIPPSGRFFYPIVGEIDANGLSLMELREKITGGLAEYKEHFLKPGDYISVAIFNHPELDRTITVPPDGHIFYPLLGEIYTGGMTIRDLRAFVADGLSKYRQFYLVPGDEISITVYLHKELDRSMIIPPDGYIFYPMVGEIDIREKNLKQLREIITDGLKKHVRNPQVGVDIVSFGMPKIVVDPQVAVDIMKINGPQMIPDPQVSIEVAAFGGQKVFILGEVKNPGVYLADGSMTLLEVIARAEGFTIDAKQKNVVLVRQGIDGPELFLFDLRKAQRDGDAYHNPLVKKGDLVFVPRTFISDVDRFFKHLSNIISPLLQLEIGYYIGQKVLGSGADGTPIAVR